MSKPNLFSHATSELSQDAVLCWLFAWAAPELEREDPHLHRLAQRLVQKCHDLHGYGPVDVRKLEIARQHGKIDILVTINDEYHLLIEDKVGSVEHSGQLERYVSAVADGTTKVVPVYIQTGDQGNYSGVEAAGYGVLRRKDLLNLMDPAIRDGCSNAILLDFYHHLAETEAKVQAFASKQLCEWDWHAWQGFFMALQCKLGQGDWRYVSNPSGGFPGFWWARQNGPHSEQYLQLEGERLCFKISVPEKSRCSELKWMWHERLMEVGKATGLKLVKPSKLRSGTTMTVLRLEDYRAADKDGVLDMQTTLETLHTAERVLAAARLG